MSASPREYSFFDAFYFIAIHLRWSISLLCSCIYGKFEDAKIHRTYIVFKYIYICDIQGIILVVKFNEQNKFLLRFHFFRYYLLIFHLPSGILRGFGFYILISTFLYSLSSINHFFCTSVHTNSNLHKFPEFSNIIFIRLIFFLLTIWDLMQVFTLTNTYMYVLYELICLLVYIFLKLQFFLPSLKIGNTM